MTELTLEQKELMHSVLDEVARERLRQHAKWGEQNWPDDTGREWMKEDAVVARHLCQSTFASKLGGSWRLIFDEEVREAFAEESPELLRSELVQCAAVATAWIEAIDRRQNKDASAS